MARNVTLLQLRTRLDTLGSLENDTSITAAQKNDALNAGYAKFYDFLIDNGLPDYFVKQVTIPVTAGTQAYALATYATDFYKLRRVCVDLGSNQLRPLEPLNEWYIQSYRPPQAGASIKLDYIPCAPVLVADADIVDGVNGWEELLIVYALLDIKYRKDDAPGWLVQKQKEIEARIQHMTRRDSQFGERIVQRNRWRFRDPYQLYSSSVDAYRLRGLNIEFYYNFGYHQV